MFHRAASLCVLALPLLAAASAVPRQTSQCNTGSIQCCNSVQSSDSSLVGLLAGLLGVVLGGLTSQVGVNCSPITVIGASGNSCSAQPACCTGNTFSGLLTVGCSPINLNL
ncbi:fungal hydrophobin-domain-containing protein [Infundibulicybe gibba]|nr:fungal hydrophobin-domain-containing protein [Infundibulicybe gibba]